MTPGSGEGTGVIPRGKKEYVGDGRSDPETGLLQTAGATRGGFGDRWTEGERLEGTETTTNIIHRFELEIE